jgi:spore germination protein
MKNDPQKTADSLIMAIIIHIYIGWGFLYLVKFAVNHLTNNAYIGLFPAAVIIIPFFWVASDLARIFPNMSICTIFCRVFGKYTGKAVGIILLLYITFYESIALRDGHLMISSYFFNRTPFCLITAVFIACALYLALNGVKAIGRLTMFMLFPPLLIIFMLELLGLVNVNFVNIQPVLAGSPWQWLSAGFDLTLILVPGTAIIFYLPFINQAKNIKKISLYSLGVVFPIFFLALLGTIGTFSTSLTKTMSWSVVEFFRLIDYPYLLLEQTGLFFLISWYALFFGAMAQGLFLIGNEFNALFPKVKRNWYILSLSVLVFAAVNIPLNIVYIQSFLLSYQRWIAFSYLGILLGTWLVARLRFKEKKEYISQK